MKPFFPAGLLAILCGLLFAGCESSAESRRKERAKQIQAIDIANGVDGLEAMTLARIYMQRVYGLCSSLEQQGNDGDYWVFGTLVGYVGTPREVIRVHKNTGQLECPDGPTISEPTKLIEPDDGIFEAARLRRQKRTQTVSEVNLR
jgi:hypothetical protein